MSRKILQHLGRRREPEGARPTLEPPRVSVLVVEDDADLRRMLATVLTAEAFQVEVATNGAECVSHVRRALPDILLLDLVLPWVNGIEALSTIRADARTKDLPVIVMTGTPTRPQELSGLGPIDILRKPFDHEGLVSLIFAILRRPHGRSRKVQFAPITS